MKKSIKQRILSTLLSILTLFSVLSYSFPIISNAASAGSVDKSGGIVLSKYFTDGTSAVESNNWEAHDSSSSATVSDSSGEALRIYSVSGTAGADAALEEELDSSDFKEIGVYARSLSNRTCAATLTVTHEAGTSEITVQIPTGEEYYIFMPLPENAGMISHITFTTSVISKNITDEGTALSVILRRAVFSSVDHSKNTEEYSAFGIDGLNGTSVKSGVPISASPVILDDSGDSYAVKIELSGNSGGLAFHFATDGENFNVYGSAVITKDRKTYIFQIEDITEDSAYRIEFSGIENADITLDGVEFIPIRVHNTYTSLGLVTKCSISDNTVSVSGSITRDTAVKYINGDLCLYEIPMWQDLESALKDEPVHSMSMSTTFSFSIPVSEDYSAFASYVVAIRDKSGVHPLSDPIFPSTGHLPGAETAISAVSGISPEEAFYSGFDKYIIDIDINELFLEKSGQNSTVFTFDGYPYYPDRDVISEIALKAQFLSAAGIGIIFRISSGDNVLSPNDSADCRIYAAAVSYLVDAYSPYGILMSIPESTDTGLSEKAYRSAAFARLTSAVAGNSIVVYTTLDEADNAAFAWILAEYLSVYPKSDCRFILPASYGDPDHADGIAACAADGGYTYGITLCASDTSVIWDNVSFILDLTEGNAPPPADDSFESFEVEAASDDGEESTVTLWDFTRSYDSDGFTVPAGPTGIYTVADDPLETYTGIPACRCLKTVLGDGSDMIIAKPKAPMDLSGCPKVKFLISCTSDSKFSFDIVFISGYRRAIFTAEYDGSGIYTPVCDLSVTDISHKIDRIAIVLREGDSVELGISTVTAAGNVTDADDTLYITEAVDTTEVSGSSDITQDTVVINTAYITVGGLIIITIVIFAALSRKKQ